MSLSDAGVRATLPTTDLDEAVEQVSAALKTEGFGALFDLDIQHTLQTKIGHDPGPYRILGACNPPLAAKAIDADPSIGMFLPCNVVLRVQGDHTLVEMIKPSAMLQGLDDPSLADLQQDADARILRAIGSLQA
jgi:Uncharacterized conserved protein